MYHLLIEKKALKGSKTEFSGQLITADGRTQNVKVSSKSINPQFIMLSVDFLKTEETDAKKGTPQKRSLFPSIPRRSVGKSLHNTLNAITQEQLPDYSVTNIARNTGISPPSIYRMIDNPHREMSEAMLKAMEAYLEQCGFTIDDHG